MKKLPVGLQDFAKIRQQDFVYVDKTAQILNLINEGVYIFFARPRRFGKSLLCSTLAYLYAGRKDLFKDLYIEDKIDWEEIIHPVIHLDLSEAVFQELSLAKAMQLQMERIGNELGIACISDSASANLQYFIQTLAKQGKKPD
jgi:hypothetical protein